MTEHFRQCCSQTDTLQHLQPLGLLAGGIAHDFNNLLTAILGNASLAHKHRQSPEQLDIYLTRIQEASQTAACLCRQMLMYAGKGNSSKGDVNISAMVKEMSRLLEVSLAKGIQLEYRLMQDLPCVQVEAVHIQQLLINLIMNANEAMLGTSGKIILSTGVMDVQPGMKAFYSQKTPRSGTYVYIRVQDHGCGMDAETQQRIFQPFFTTKGTGHGLGMTTILHIVYGHQGIIRVQSEPEKGVTMTVAFPAMDNQSQDDNMIQEYDALNPVHINGKVLLVDDEEVVLETMQVMLEDLGCDTLLAQDGEQAISMYARYQHEIALVVLDFTMPKMSGSACVAALKALNQDVKIILCSGYTEEDVCSQLDACDVTGFLPKPCSLEQLHQTLQKVLA